MSSETGGPCTGKPSCWLESGKVTLMELQKLMRHKNITMTMRYAHLFPGQESEKLSIIGDMLA